jgi:hypothetical protein
LPGGFRVIRRIRQQRPPLCQLPVHFVHFTTHSSLPITENRYRNRNRGSRSTVATTANRNRNRT